MASIQGGSIRAVRLDSDGKPVGEFVELGDYKLLASSPRYDSGAVFIGQAFVNLSMEMKLSAKAFKRLARVMYGDREWRRSRWYARRTAGDRPAPRRRNRHGRTGVLRR